MTQWKRSLLGDDFFSKLAEEAENDEGSDVSEADPTALLERMKDIDDMDADLFGSKKKPSSAPAQSKGSGIGGPMKNPPKSGNKLKGGGISDELHIEEKKPSSAPASTARGYQRFSFTGELTVLSGSLASLATPLVINDPCHQISINTMQIYIIVHYFSLLLQMMMILPQQLTQKVPKLTVGPMYRPKNIRSTVKFIRVALRVEFLTHHKAY
ncbi:fas-binding factor 1 homolog [Salvelinus namaycush]|uniref:Fas-binding factor 1 homolog n=1 Tax=Salvelinus namaycush TaxID=8040 RepID=A0A8U0QCM5_SALNM|nr:fas-binding factor 1 homolog [Salvelinus namaycush]XP_038840563.1 fas-binding factor 1 homolog [Salvelinus namaycush]